MSIPSINYNDATKLFSSVKDQNSYITPSLLTTTHKEESASVELVCSLAKIALEGLKEEVQKKAESPNKLRAQVESVKNYLIKIKDAPKGGDLNDIFLKLFVEVDTEIKQIEKLEEFIGEQELKTFPGEKLLAIMSDEIHKYDFEIPLAITSDEILRFDFEKYGFKSERTKIRFAKLMAEQDGTLISNIIQNFGIKNEVALIEIAQLSAKSNGSGTSEHILNYGITNQRALVNIAKLAAQNDGTGATNYHIKKYGIKDEDDRIEIAKAAALKNTMSFVEDIENYDIKNQNALVEIAKLAASVDGSTVSYKIKRFKIEKESDRFEIAKIAAQQNGWKTSEYIKEYGILNESALIEIAKISAQESGIGVSFSIQNYNIKSYPARFDIFLIAYKENPKGCLTQLKKYNLLFPQLNVFSKNPLSPSYRNPTLLEIQKTFKWPDEFSPIFKELSQGTPNENDLFFLIYVGCKFLQKPCLLKDGKILASIFQYKDQKMRHDLTDLAFDLTEKQIKLYESFSTPGYLQLPALIFCSGSQTDKDPAIYHALLAGKKEFKDGLLQKALLDSLYLLIIKNRLDTRESIHLLKKALSANIKTNLLCIQGILYCGGKDILRKEAQNENLNLDIAYQNAFNQSIPFKPVKNFAEKYERTFGICALPSAPLIYAGKLRQLSRDDQKKALLCLGGYIHSVLENDYQGIRYKGSEHLEKIFTKQSSLRSNWPKEVEVPLEDYIKSTTSKIIFNPQTFLLEKILRDGHLPKEKYTDLFQFLETKEDKAAEEILVGLNKKIMEIADADKERIVQAKAIKDALAIIKHSKDKSLGQKLKSLKDAGKKIMELPGITEGLETIEKLIQANRKQQKIENPEQIKIVEGISSQFTKVGEEALSHLTLKQEIRQERQQIQLQKDLIDLYRSKPPLSRQLNLLGKIQKNLNPLEEFHNDVKGIMESLTKKKESTEEYTLVNTDRFDLMLISGTQVQGSCQRIDGSPSLNKCLLAYLVDGKNRLVAIKDKKGNIVARSILRLLWDKTKDRPALMQERIYSNVLDSSMTDALDKFAVDQAKSLGVSLYQADVTGSAQLESFGGPAPWEYVDSAEGVMPNSIFTITGAIEVYIHPSS